MPKIIKLYTKNYIDKNELSAELLCKDVVRTLKTNYSLTEGLFNQNCSIYLAIQDVNTWKTLVWRLQKKLEQSENLPKFHLLSSGEVTIADEITRIINQTRGQVFEVKQGGLVLSETENFQKIILRSDKIAILVLN